MKRSKDWNKTKFERFIKEGRGQGELSEYKPWLTIQDLPSLGRVSRLYSYKTGRIHHFFSDIQTRYFYLLEWAEKVVDIRENYPLLDIREVLNDEDLELDKYKSEDGTDYVFTTTFLINIKDERGSYMVARTLKASHELERGNVIERFEIERRYWKKKNVDWGIVTNKEILKIKAKNIEWVYSALEIDRNEDFKQEEKECLCTVLISKINESSLNMRHILQDFDAENKLQEGTGLLFLRYLIAKKIVVVNMEENINMNVPADILVLSIKSEGAVIKYASNS